MVVKQESPLKMGILFTGMGLVVSMLFFFVPDFSPSASESFHRTFLFALSVYSMLFGSFMLARVPYWKRLDQRRQTAAQGNTTLPLVPIQAARSEVSFHLPLYIVPRRNGVFIFPLYFFLMLGWDFLFFGRELLDGIWDGDWLFLLICGIIATGISSWSLLPLLLRRQNIEATTDKLVVKNGALWWSSSARKECVIRWDDARLFAVYGGKPGQPGTRYELAGADVSVQWRDYRQSRWWSLQRADERYAEQMEMLLAYISARAGLPLYDLR